MSFLQWTLREEFIIAEIDRLNHPDYFALNFECPDMDSLFSEIKTYEQATTNRELLNKVYDNLIASNCTDRTIYVRLKWLAYLHKLIRFFRDGDLMATLTLKALQVYTDKLHLMGLQADRFSKYLSTSLLRPYLQYLSKRCMLLSAYRPPKSTQDKQNFIPNQTTSTAIVKASHNKNYDQTESIIADCQDKLKWYRQYNFVREGLETFSKVLMEQEPFFASQLSCLLNIRANIASDMRAILKKWKTNNIPLNQLGITLIELDNLEIRILDFGKSSADLFSNSESMMTEVDDYTKQEITNFMCTPLKSFPNMDFQAQHINMH